MAKACWRRKWRRWRKLAGVMASASWRNERRHQRLNGMLCEIMAYLYGSIMAAGESKSSKRASMKISSGEKYRRAAWRRKSVEMAKIKWQSSVKSSRTAAGGARALARAQSGCAISAAGAAPALMPAAPRILTAQRCLRHTLPRRVARRTGTLPREGVKAAAK